MENPDVKIDINAIDRYGCTPLDDARRHGNQIMMSMLEHRGGKSGADPGMADAHLAAARKIEEERRQQVPMQPICFERFKLGSVWLSLVFPAGCRISSVPMMGNSELWR